MKKRDGLGLRGSFRFRVFRAGALVAERRGFNLIVSAGKAAIAGLANGLHADPFAYLALGTGTTAPDAADTTLETEITTNGGARALATLSQVTTDVTDDTAQLVKTFAITGNLAVTEAGVFDALAVGTMLCRHTFTVINLVNGDSLEVTYQLDVD
jgi:hypothetical protein